MKMQLRNLAACVVLLTLLKSAEQSGSEQRRIAMSTLSKVLPKLCVVVAVVAMTFVTAFSVPTTMAAASTPETASTAAGALPGQIVSDPNCVQPPANVDHATFTDAQLALYGLPPRPTGELLPAWQKAVRSAKHRVCTGTVTNVRHATPEKQPAPSAGYEYSDNWGGNEAIDYGYTGAVGEWNVPCLTLLLHDGGSAAWAGIGGDNSDGGGNLVQSGTQQTEYSNLPGHWTATYFAWIEDYPWNPTEIEKFSVNCGDPMYAYDWQDYSNGNPTSANMYIEDQRSGQYAESNNHNAFSNGSTAEWIIERNGSNGDLSDFNYINFTDCYAYLGSNPVNPINLPHNYSTIYYNSHSLVSVGPLYQDSSDVGAHFQVTFLHPY